MKRSDMMRFFDKIKVNDSGCWEWQGHLNNRGYGQFSYRGKSIGAHRFMYELQHDIKLTTKTQIDHLCKNRICVNPDHFEVVNNRANTLRGMGPTAINARREECVNGHPFDEENTYIRPDNGHRQCKACVRERSKIKLTL